MKNITAQYKLLQEGKMSKDAFIRSARMSFPQYISPVTSFNDAVSILKGKRLLSETNIVNEAGNTNLTSITISFEDESKLKKFKNTPTLSQLLSSDQLKLIKVGDTKINVNRTVLGKLKNRFNGILYTLKEVSTKSEAKKEINEAATNSGYTYIQEKPKVPEIDLVNPYQLKKGIEFELSKMSDFTGNAYLEAVDKAVKAIVKDKDKYKDLQIANFKEVQKIDQENKMTEVGKKTKSKDKTDSAGYMKKPVKKNEGANVTVKKEDKRGKPKGVKEMTNKPKTAKGISKTMELPGKEKVLKALKEHLTKKKEELTEDMHHEYTQGMEVHTPSGIGKVHEIIGSTITVELANGGMQDFQVNVLNKQREVIKNAPQMEAPKEEPKKGITKEQVMNKLKEFFSKKKKKNETVDIVTAQTSTGDTTTVATVPTGQGKQKVAKLKQQGVRTANSQTLK